MVEMVSQRPAQVHPSSAIQAFNLSKKFVEEYAVQELSFDIPQGVIFGFIGPSGCGKTTTVRLLTGVYQPTSGSVTVLGKNPLHFSANTRAKIGYLPQMFVLYPDLSVWENLNFAASLYGINPFRRKERLNDILEFVELSEHRAKLVRNISGGMQRRLSLASTLVPDPELIFLDEPTAGIDPVLRAKFWDHFKELEQQGRTLFITTQYVGEAAYCDYVGVMANGRLLIVDTPEGLRRRAFGGQVINLQTSNPISYDRIQALQSLGFVRGRIRFTGENAIQMTVDDGSRAIPELIEWGNANNISFDTVNEFVPPFDDVFVQLIKEGVKDA